jgi:hypothetical protein
MEIWKVRQDFILRRAVCQHFENVLNANPHSANAWLAPHIASD